MPLPIEIIAWVCIAIGFILVLVVISLVAITIVDRIRRG